MPSWDARSTSTARRGDGFLESAYGDALEVEFKKAAIPYVREDSVRIYYDGQPLPTNYRADFTCFDRGYIVELKAIKTITKVEWAQVIHYLRATQIPYALLINFGRPRIQYDTFDLNTIKQRSQTINSDKSESSTNVPLHQDCGQGPQMKTAER